MTTTTYIERYRMDSTPGDEHKDKAGPEVTREIVDSVRYTRMKTKDKVRTKGSDLMNLRLTWGKWKF